MWNLKRKFRICCGAKLKRKKMENFRSSHRRCSIKKVLLEITQNSQENTCAKVSFLIKFQASGSNFIKKDTLAQVFSCEICKISKNTFLNRTPLSYCFWKPLSMHWKIWKAFSINNIILADFFSINFPISS